VEEKQAEIYTEMLKNLPTQIQYSKFEKENPFSLYCSYLDYVRPMDIEAYEKDMKDDMDSL
jgi:hypothetical protein